MRRSSSWPTTAARPHSPTASFTSTREFGRGGHGTRHRDTVAAPVRAHRHVPLPVRPLDARAVHAARHHGDGLRHDLATDLAADDEVLGDPVRYQLCAWGCHRYHHGIPVRNELELFQ